MLPGPHHPGFHHPGQPRGPSHMGGPPPPHHHHGPPPPGPGGPGKGPPPPGHPGIAATPLHPGGTLAAPKGGVLPVHPHTANSHRPPPPPNTTSVLPVGLPPPAALSIGLAAAD